MGRKAQIIRVLGERALLLPDAVDEALLANNRVKLLFTVLEAARDHAERAEAPMRDPVADLFAGVLDDATGAQVALAARPVAPGLYRIPRAREIHDEIIRAIRAMIAPLELAGIDDVARTYRNRLDALVLAAPDLADDLVSADYISALTRAAREGPDSMHLLVMDLHHELNALQRTLAQEVLDGAMVYGLQEADRPLVRAFMSGLNATARLKFDHPGLETTATRSGDALLLQNDIGTTEAHVLVVQVRGLTATVTYTDVHPERARFFRSQFDDFPMRWMDTEARSAPELGEPSYVMLVGVLEALTQEELERFLQRLGARIVFLINWNRARRTLRAFVRRTDRVPILQWAVDNSYGHCAFLQLGGARLVAEAIEQAARAPLRYGERLDRMIGNEAAVAYLHQVLRVTAEGLLAGRSERQIVEEVKAELLPYFPVEAKAWADIVEELVTLLVDLAHSARDGLQEARLGADASILQRRALRARSWAQAVDQLVDRARQTIPGSSPSGVGAGLLSSADRAAHALEAGMSLIAQLPAASAMGDSAEPDETLAEVVVDAAHTLAQATLAAAALRDGGTREDSDDLIAALGRLATVERDVDEAAPRIQAHLLRGAGDFRQQWLVAALASALERAASALAAVGLELDEQSRIGVSG